LSDAATAVLVDPAAVTPLQPWPEPHVPFFGGSQQEAFDAGVKAGRAEALSEEAEAGAAARRALEDAAGAFRQAAAELRAVRAEALRADVHDAMALVVEVAEALIGALPPRVSAHRIAEALALAPEDELATIHLHPDDAETAFSLPVDAKVVADESVERGGCIVEVGPTRIDAQLGTALGRLRNVLEVPPR
jgi:flagellar assembly protein FliH